mmetsp:Transcript_13129/g.39676  ORF Transcript_13129/g.39676 Transcript_13129/m.39676 type:complete len:251 (-) Transcript_13129:838-1590(-)
MHSSPEREITGSSGSKYKRASFEDRRSCFTNNLASGTLRPSYAPTTIVPLLKPCKYVSFFACANLTLSFWEEISSFSHQYSADFSEDHSPGTSIFTTGITSYGTTISSVICGYLERSLASTFNSCKAIQSSGASEGTEVTTPVPFDMEMVSRGRTYTLSYVSCSGARTAAPSKSQPLTVARLCGAFVLKYGSYSPFVVKEPWWAMPIADRCDVTSTSPFAVSKRPYSPSGSTKQFVWPYIVSGLNVAGAK